MKNRVSNHYKKDIIISYFPSILAIMLLSSSIKGFQLIREDFLPKQKITSDNALFRKNKHASLLVHTLKDSRYLSSSTHALRSEEALPLILNRHRGAQARRRGRLGIQHQNELDRQLITAVRENRSELTRNLIARGANPRKKYRGIPLLHIALFLGHTACAQILLQYERGV